MYQLKYRRQARNYLARLPVKIKSEPLYDQNEVEDYIFMNPVKREHFEKGWTQKELANRIGVKQATVSKWEREGAVYRKATRQKLAKVFGIGETSFS